MVTGLLLERGANIVATVDRDPALAGSLLSDLVSAAPPCTIAASVDDLQVEADAAIVTTRSSLAECADDFRALLERGLAVVSSCEELIYPWQRQAALAQTLDDCARAHGGRLLGTGVNPGYLMDAFALATTAVCTQVRGVYIERIQDATTRRVPFQRKIGATMEPAALEAAVSAGTMGHVGLLESVQFLAAGLGVDIDRTEQDTSAVIAERATPSGVGDIAAGSARGIRQTARAYAGDDLVIELVFHAAVAEGRNIDRIKLDSDPPVGVTWQNGVHGDVATTAILVNAVDSLLAAAPGLHTMMTIPPARVR